MYLRTGSHYISWNLCSVLNTSFRKLSRNLRITTVRYHRQNPLESTGALSTCSVEKFYKNKTVSILKFIRLQRLEDWSESGTFLTTRTPVLPLIALDCSEHHLLGPTVLLRKLPVIIRRHNFYECSIRKLLNASFLLLSTSVEIRYAVA